MGSAKEEGCGEEREGGRGREGSYGLIEIPSETNKAPGGPSKTRGAAHLHHEEGTRGGMWKNMQYDA